MFTQAMGYKLPTAKHHFILTHGWVGLYFHSKNKKGEKRGGDKSEIMKVIKENTIDTGLILETCCLNNFIQISASQILKVKKKLIKTHLWAGSKTTGISR